MAHLWHAIETGKKSPEEVNAIIEISKDSTIKYELDKKWGIMKLDRFLYSPVHYPGDYGLIPQTYSEDNDPLDILVLTNIALHPGTLALVRPIGIIRMRDGKEQDDKIIAVYANNPRFEEYKDVENIPKHTIKELRHFFEIYKELQNKKVKVMKFLGKKEAQKKIKDACRVYKEKFSMKKQHTEKGKN